VALTYALLGPIMAILRPIAGIFLGIFAGVMTGLRNKPEQTGDAITICCSEPVDSDKPIVQQENCCAASSTPHKPVATQSRLISPAKLVDGLIYAFSNMVDDLKQWLMIGIIAAGLVISFMSTEFLTQWGSGPVAMMVMILVGVPMYICATASTPLAVSFAAVGLSPGTVMVFLLAGPATNIGTLGILKQEFGLRALTAYLLAVVVGSLAIGLGVDWMFQQWGLSLNLQNDADYHSHLAWYHYVSALVLAILFIKPLRSQLFSVAGLIRRTSDS